MTCEFYKDDISEFPFFFNVFKEILENEVMLPSVLQGLIKLIPMQAKMYYIERINQLDSMYLMLKPLVWRSSNASVFCFKRNHTFVFCYFLFILHSFITDHLFILLSIYHIIIYIYLLSHLYTNFIDLLIGLLFFTLFFQCCLVS